MRAPAKYSIGLIVIAIKPSMCELRVGPSAEFSTALDRAEGRGISCVNNFVTFLIECLEAKLKLAKLSLEISGGEIYTLS